MIRGRCVRNQAVSDVLFNIILVAFPLVDAGSTGRIARHAHARCINVEKAGSYALAIHYSSIGFDSTPRLFAN